jgi:hypothetical protein
MGRLKKDEANVFFLLLAVVVEVGRRCLRVARSAGMNNKTTQLYG